MLVRLKMAWTRPSSIENNDKIQCFLASPAIFNPAKNTLGTNGGRLTRFDCILKLFCAGFTSLETLVMASLMSSVVNLEDNLDNQMNLDMDNLENLDSSRRASLDLTTMMMWGVNPEIRDTASLVLLKQNVSMISC